jgi:hypothetical protein
MYCIQRSEKMVDENLRSFEKVFSKNVAEALGRNGRRQCLNNFLVL